MNITLIKEWRNAWKLTSVQWALALATANGLFAVLPMLSDSVPIWLYALIMCFGNIGIVILRLMAQPNLK